MITGKVKDLLRAEGCDATDEHLHMMLQQALFDGVDVGICKNEGCDYTTTVEPDCREGYCEECETQTVVSLTELALF